MTTTEEEEEEEEEEGLKKIYALCCWEYCKGDNSMSEILIYAYISLPPKPFECIYQITDISSANYDKKELIND